MASRQQHSRSGRRLGITPASVLAATGLGARVARRRRRERPDGDMSLAAEVPATGAVPGAQAGGDPDLVSPPPSAPQHGL